ncbi:hypothetical protein FB567DRAFT_588349 [Paraphoma chrysanthemicola]|uniref:Uncharacterized protein n=1 Tax=Paraphoma chrysanthemicola TaxID=798071 RepID=A0A8K0RFC9_9PLEO|nr:hypothetical protein FB567DRAFT_588349 [Paraphoma chrysanthemicola]
MSTRTVYLLIYPGQSGQRAHFAIWVPYEEGGSEGTVIHVVGAPMAGFSLQFKRCYNPADTRRLTNLVPIGSVVAQNVHDFQGGRVEDTTPRGNIELAAAQVQPPRASANFLAPVNDTTNRRCQEWTTDYVRRLVALQYIDESAIAIVHARRDAPDYGIRLRPVAARPQQDQQQSAAAAPVWIWDAERREHKRWDGEKWVWQS